MSAMLFALVALGLISALLASVMIQAWRWVDRKPHLLAWALAHGAAAIQWLCMLADRLLLQGGAEFWVLANALALVVLSGLLAGYRLRSGLPARVPLLIGIGLVVEAAVVWFTSVAPHLGMAAAIMPLYASIILVFCSHALLLRGQPVLPAEWGSVVVLLAFAIAQFAAAVVASGVGGSDAPAALDLYAAVHYLTLPAAYAGIGIFSVFLIATDLAEQMKRLAITDALTGVLNRRGFMDAALRAISFAQRTGTPMTLVMADIDEFKRLNDTYGHATGDRALRMFAGQLEGALRRSDLIGRVGGEEFAMVLGNTDTAGGHLVATRLRQSIEQAVVEARHAHIKLTASFGVASFSSEDGDLEDVIERADRALYLAKETGRNRVCVAPEDAMGREFAPV